MKIYLAGAWSRREELLEVADNLEVMGHEITARWLTQETAAADQDSEEFLAKHAEIDMQDVIIADAIVRFSDAEEMAFPLANAKLVSGARHFEFGGMWMLDRIIEYSNAAGFGAGTRKLLFVVGGKQNIFDRFPQVMHISNLPQLYDVFYRAAYLEGLYVPLEEGY